MKWLKWMLPMLVAFCTPTLGQAQPSCYGTSTNSTTGVVSYYALQYKASPPKQWLCTLIPGGTPGPAGAPGKTVPPMLDCGSSPTQFWDGNQWTCVSTNFLTAQ